MSLNMSIEVTSGVAATEVDDETAADLAEAYEALSKLPVNRQVSVDFPDTKAARLFVKQGKAWAANTEVDVPATDTTPARKSTLTFARKGDIKGNPNRVSFRIYIPRPEKDDK